MLYLRLCFDRADRGDLRARELKGHREYVAAHLEGKSGVRIVQGGPMCAGDDLAHNIGSFLIIDAPSLGDAERFHEEDPFTQAGLFERFDVIRWDRHVGNPDEAAYIP